VDAVCDNHTYESYALHLPSSDKLTLIVWLWRSVLQGC